VARVKRPLRLVVLIACPALSAAGFLLGLPTAASADHAAPTGLRVTGTTADSVSLDWSDYTAFAVRGYRVSRYTPLGTLIERRMIGTTSAYTWTGLQPSTTYRFRVQAVRSSDGHLSSRSGAVSAATQGMDRPPTTPPAPTGLHVTDVLTDQVYFEWNPYTAFSEDGFLVALHNAGGLIEERDKRSPEDPSPDMWWPGLQADTDYQLRVRAYDDTPSGRVLSDWSPFVQFRTDPGTPPPTQCSDGVDNADPEDTLVDLADPGCADAQDNDETDPSPPSSCRNPPCWDWLGNTFPGGPGLDAINHVPEAARDMAVSGDGYVVVGNQWVESSHDVRVITPGGVVDGPMPAHKQCSAWPNDSCRFREHGGGPKAVAIDNAKIYATNARRVVFWDRTTFLGQSTNWRALAGDSFTVPGTGDLLGLAVGGWRIFVTDGGTAVGRVAPDTTQIKALDASTGAVLNTWTVPRSRHLDVDRQGNLWVLQQRAATAAPRLSRWSPTGASLGGFDLTGYPTDVGASRTADEVLITDNGVDQRVERYSYSGTQVGTFGESYLNGPTPGLIGPGRFAGPGSVDTADNGDIYTHEAFAPNRGDGFWADDQPNGVRFSRYQADGTRGWERHASLGTPGEASNDRERYYQGNITYVRGADGRYRQHALNVDPFSGNDIRLTDGNLGFGSQEFSTTMEREFDGQRWLVKVGGFDNFLRVWRRDGELFRYVRDFGSAEDLYMAENGDVFRSFRDGHIDRIPYLGGGAWGTAQSLGIPSGFTFSRRVRVVGNTIYVSGFGPGAEYTDNGWKEFGKRIARFDFANLHTATSFPAPRWSKTVYYGTQEWDKPTSMAADQDRVVVAYLSDNNTFGNRRLSCYVRPFDAATGNERPFVVSPDLMGRSGACDMKRSVTLKDGLLSIEDNHHMKAILADLG
jgi:hypothetical protein